MGFNLAWLLTGAGTALILGFLFVLLYTKKIGTKMEKKNRNLAMGALTVVAILCLASGYGLGYAYDKVKGGAEIAVISADGAPDGDEVTVTYKQVGSSSTVTLNAYTGTWGKLSTKTEVFPLFTILDSKGQILVDGSRVNTTTTSVGEILSIYGTGADYYVDAVDFKVENDRPTQELKAYTISANTDPQIIVYDNTGATALSAHPNTSETYGPDYYTADLGAGESDLYIVKFQNKVADKQFDLSYICTFYPTGQEIADYKVVGTDSTSSSAVLSPTWTEAEIPKGMRDTTIQLSDGDLANTSMDYMHCYKSSAKVRLSEWDWIKITTEVKTDAATGPSLLGDSYFGAVFLDAQWYKDVSGAVKYDAYKKGDDIEDPGSVGCDENTNSTWLGLDLAYAVEAR